MSHKYEKYKGISSVWTFRGPEMQNRGVERRRERQIRV